VYCTGYRITFPFFDEDFVSAPDNRIALFRRRRYVASKRHTIQIDFDDYLRDLERERRAGAARARAAGFPLPVPARAAVADEQVGA
jgi:hypothetical protein